MRVLCLIYLNKYTYFHPQHTRHNFILTDPPFPMIMPVVNVAGIVSFAATLA